MDDKQFWRIIDLLDGDSVGDDDAVLEPAIEALAALPEGEIFAFEDLLAEKLHAIDTREHCRACYAGDLDPDSGDDYISADDFLYCRCAVVASGSKYYKTVLSNPKKMPQEVELEALLSLALHAHERKTGKEYNHTTPVSYESFENKEGWKPTPDTRKGRFTGKNIPPGNRRPT